MQWLLAQIEAAGGAGPAVDAAAKAVTTGDWLTTFRSFTLFHVVTVLACAVAMGASCVIGRSFGCGSPRETKFRRAWGWWIVAYQLFITIYYAIPFSLSDSLPLEVCDLAAWIAAGAMLTRKRWMRTVLYFWGIGLSTQAFATPIIKEGLGTFRYWQFWMSHVVIVGSAVYDVVVGGYRPGLKDLRNAILISLGYLVFAFTFNIAMGTNYGYVGKSKPENPTIIDKLGAWPGRVGIMVVIVLTDFFVLWGVWALARKLGLSRPEGKENAEDAVVVEERGGENTLGSGA